MKTGLQYFSEPRPAAVCRHRQQVGKETEELRVTTETKSGNITPS